MNEEQDPLWELLAQSRPKKRDTSTAVFTQNVLRKIRQTTPEQPAPGSVFAWLLNYWHQLIYVPAVAILVALVIPMLRPTHSPEATPATVALAQPAIQIASVDLQADTSEAIIHIDELLAYEQNREWLNDNYF